MLYFYTGGAKVRCDGPPPDGFQTYRKRVTTWAKAVSEPFQVKTLEGVMTAKAGDYLCADNKGNLYPCDKEVFESSYERVDGGEVAK